MLFKTSTKIRVCGKDLIPHHIFEHKLVKSKNFIIQLSLKKKSSGIPVSSKKSKRSYFDIHLFERFLPLDLLPMET